MKRSLIAIALVALVALTFVVPATARDAGDRRGSTVHRVTMRSGATNRFRPATITIDHGDRIKWTNTAGVTHTTTSNDADWDARVAPGDSFTRRFRRAGTFRYHCSIHPEMTGTIIVQ